MSRPSGRLGWRPGRPHEQAERNPEDGQVALLILAYCIITFLLVTVVVSLTAIHIARTRLVNLADAAALDAADSLENPTYYGAGGSGGGAGGGAGQGSGPTAGVVPLSDATVRASVHDYLATAPVNPALENLTIGDPTGALASDAAQVTLVALVRPPLVTYVLAMWGGGITIHVTSQAVATRHQG